MKKGGVTIQIAIRHFFPRTQSEAFVGGIVTMEEKQKSAKAAHVTERPPKTCFVIGPIGDEDTEIRKKADQVEKYIIRRALEHEYHVERAEAIKRPGIVIDQVVRKVVGADLVVADLADMNPNVFYELGIRHTFGKPTVHLVPTNQKPATPFDVSQIRFILYDLANPDSVEAAKEELRQQALAITERGVELITPVQMAEIKHSWDKLDARDRMIFGVLENLGSAISRIESYTQPPLYTTRNLSLGPMIPLRGLLPGGVQQEVLDQMEENRRAIAELEENRRARARLIERVKKAEKKNKPSETESSETH